MCIMVDSSKLSQAWSDSASLHLLGQEEDDSLDFLYGNPAVKGQGNLLNKD